MGENSNKIYVILGHYGSGKSEFAVNFAYHLKGQKREVALVDLDIVNPYFRSREVREQLQADDIDVASDLLDSTIGLDMPYVSPAIQGLIHSSRKDIIIDCGGDPVGLIVMKQFIDLLRTKDVQVLMVVNVFRPQTNDCASIIKMKEELEDAVRLKVDAFVHNSNYLRNTTLREIEEADSIMKQVSLYTKTPIRYISGITKLLNQLPEEIGGERFPLTLRLRKDWL